VATKWNKKESQWDMAYHVQQTQSLLWLTWQLQNPTKERKAGRVGWIMQPRSSKACEFYGHARRPRSKTSFAAPQHSHGWQSNLKLSMLLDLFGSCVTWSKAEDTIDMMRMLEDDGAGHWELNSLDGQGTIRMNKSQSYHKHHLHHGQRMMLNLSDDKARTHSLLYSQQGGAGVIVILGTSHACIGYGILQPQ
jgi:hypothetical protein